jgi:hypothetical protein
MTDVPFAWGGDPTRDPHRQGGRSSVGFRHGQVAQATASTLLIFRPTAIRHVRSTRGRGGVTWWWYLEEMIVHDQHGQTVSAAEFAALSNPKLRAVIDQAGDLKGVKLRQRGSFRQYADDDGEAGGV